MLGSERGDCFELIRQGILFIEAKNFSMAKMMFEKSVQISPTAEGLTYLALMYSYEKDYTVSIELCKQAILLDPSYGNPYNDIGTYLVEQQRLRESIEWFEKAKNALRYDERRLPYLNLGRLYIRLSNVDDAKKEYESLLEFEPDNIEAQLILGQFVGLSLGKKIQTGIFSSN